MNKILKKLLSLFVGAALTLGTIPAMGDELAASSMVYINDSPVSIQGYNIYGNNYFKLRDLAYYMSMCADDAQFDVSWDEEKKSAELVTNTPYSGEAPARSISSSLTYQESDSVILVDGKEADIKAYNVNGSNYCMLRDLAPLLGFDVVWSQEKSAVYIYDCEENAVVASHSGGVGATDLDVDGGNPRYQSVIKTALSVNDDDGTLTAVNVSSDGIHIDTYNGDYELLSSKLLQYELDRFGGVYFGEEYNFIVFGQNNPNEDDDLVTFETVKYSKDWEILGRCDYKNNNTVAPFDFGTLRMVEYNGYLYVRSCHKMYKSSDGNNHQSNITYSVNIDTMKIADSFSDVLNISYGYCSHSFNQFLAVDDGALTAVDLGDAYPRSVVLGKYTNSLKSGKFISGGSFKSLDLLEIPGSTGANCTGVCIGGFEIGSDNYIVAVNMVDFSKVTGFTSSEIIGTDTEQRDAVLLISDKDNKKTSGVKQVYLTDYSGNGKTCTQPYIVGVGEGKYMVMWEEFELREAALISSAATRQVPFYTSTKYVTVNEDGEMLEDVRSINASIGCQPVFNGEEVVWYENAKAARIFHSIEI